MRSSLPSPLYLRAVTQKKDTDQLLQILSRIEISAPAAHVGNEVNAVRALLGARIERSESDHWQSVEDAIFRLSVSLEKERQRDLAKNGEDGRPALEQFAEQLTDESQPAGLYRGPH